MSEDLTLVENERLLDITDGDEKPNVPKKSETKIEAILFTDEGEVYKGSEKEVKESIEKNLEGERQENAGESLNDIQIIEKELTRVIGGEISFVESYIGTIDGELPGDEIEEPPIKFSTWSKTMEISARLARCIRTIARNTVGLGWEIVPKKEVNEDTPDDVKKAIAEETARCEAIFESPNRNMPLSKVFELMKIDQEVIGNGYIEVVEGNTGEISAIYHVMGKDVKILRHGRGFVQNHGTRAVTYFKPFGISDKDASKWFNASNAVMDSRTGRYVGEKLESGRKVEPPPVEYRASSIIHFPIYDPGSPVYGLPRYIPCALSIAGNRMAARRNVAFFRNDAVGRMAIMVTGGKLSQQSIDNIKMFMDAGKGVENAHRVMILQVDNESDSLVEGGPKPSIQIMPLTIGVNEDASFEKYRNANNEEVRELFGIAQIFFSSDNVNKASAGVGKETTDEQEFEPERINHEFIVNHNLMKHESLNVKHVKFKFKRPKFSDPTERAGLTRNLNDMASITPNEIRREFGLPPFPDSFKFANKPILVAIKEFQMGVSVMTDGEKKSIDAIKDVEVKERKHDDIPESNQKILEPEWRDTTIHKVLSNEENFETIEKIREKLYNSAETHMEQDTFQKILLAISSMKSQEDFEEIAKEFLGDC